MRFTIPRERIRWIVALAITISAIVGAVLLILYAVNSLRQFARKAQSASNLKHLGIAFHKFHEDHDRLPAPILSEDGEPLLSWRVAILPYLQEQALYREFRLDEAWDSPHNKPLLSRMPHVFVIPGSPNEPGLTFYRSFSGPNTLFDPADKKAVGYSAVTDGNSNTVAIIEAREAVPWTRPDSEIPFAGKEDKKGIALRTRIGGHFSGGFHVLMLDGEVKFANDTISGRVLKAIVTKNGGENLYIIEDTGDGTKAETDFEENKSLFAAIKKADRFLLYEGLPHQRSELALLESETRAKATVTLQGFQFYQETLEVSPRDQERLKRLVEDENSFRELRGVSLCCEFHPDYLAEWRVDGTAYQFLICFGCGEAKAFGPDHSLRCDIEDKAEFKIREMLKKYHKNRPRPAEK
jgi:hypothetical protein